MADVSANDFDRLFDDAMAALRPLAGQPDPHADSAPGAEQGAADGGAEPTGPVRGVGEALDGYVRVTAKPGGELETVELNPRVLRSDSESIAEAFREAANAALADLQAKLTSALPALADQQQMLERLQEFQQQSVMQMRRYLQAITDVQDRLDRD
ncbi:YbaB/EbfC family nucleoid-associated protein [Actinopolymorpha singaporensis]|uniref:YbaB/EbfC family nucleoid-associated protein n=1 Tax=Actinopolymorpha singaporensis TaxID=117157 RepID=UPI0012FE16E5|nr:YbaB/EbfC family nucleoid-associated protein [Actinopolymorpha singaporensis]